MFENTHRRRAMRSASTTAALVTVGVLAIGTLGTPAASAAPTSSAHTPTTASMAEDIASLGVFIDDAYAEDIASAIGLTDHEITMKRKEFTSHLFNGWIDECLRNGGTGPAKRVHVDGRNWNGVLQRQWVMEGARVIRVAEGGGEETVTLYFDRMIIGA
ncbi:hypothetical protein ACFXO2_23350 [Streptomyces sp. NPDC059152]|uniref:hypothetical protein n=1 Tax=Streptomyces sp. NPDC059152 TaxID=3346742 RepID=UPI003687BF57